MPRLKTVVLVVLAAGLVAAVGYPWLVRQLGGAFDPPRDYTEALSPGARELIARAFDGIERGRLRDYHVHLIGTDRAVGTWVNPRILSWRGGWHRIKGDVYMSSSGVTDLGDSNTQFLERLTWLATSMPQPVRLHILAFDYHYTRSGQRDLELSEFHTPNAYVMDTAEGRRDLFEPVVSVHPYRADAVAALKDWSQRGARFVKWLPNAQGMDPADPGLDLFYRTMRSLNMVLLVHVGEEQAVHAPEYQALGNPLRLRRALQAGVKVIMAHAASLGRDADFDHGGRMVPSFDLFLRMMDEEPYRGLLFGELSATTQYNRLPRPLRVLLERDDLHPRLVNGSDYPLPAVNVVIRTRELARHGFISAGERVMLNEIYRYNPLLFDFVLKRTLRHPQTGASFPAQVFQAHPEL